MDAVQLLKTFQPTLSTVRVLLVFLVAFLFAHLVLRRAGRLPPGPLGIPGLGYLPFLGTEFHLTFRRLAQRFGPVYQVALGGKRLVVISDARIVREAYRQPVFSGRPDTELTKILQGYGRFCCRVHVAMCQYVNVSIYHRPITPITPIDQPFSYYRHHQLGRCPLAGTTRFLAHSSAPVWSQEYAGGQQWA